MVAAQETVVRFEAELQEGLQRLEDLKSAAVPTNRPPVDPAPTMSGDQAEEVKLLRTAVMESTRERDSLRSRVPPTAPVDDPSNILAVVPVQPGGSSGVLIDGFRSSTDVRPVHTILIGRRSGSPASAVRVVAHRCGFRGCRVGEAVHPGPMSRQRRRLPALPWSWDSDSELETDPRPIRDGVVRTQVDSCSDVPSDLLDAMERDLTMEIPRRRVERAFNNGSRTPMCLQADSMCSPVQISTDT